MISPRIGIIGGSGLYQMESLTEVEEVAVETPFGSPSDVLAVGRIGGVGVAFLPRHGRGHRLTPTELPFRANIWALKHLGVEFVVSITAVGSLREEIRPLDLVIPDQIIDRTKSRVNSFFEGGVVVHAAFADPFCPDLSRTLAEVARGTGVTVHEGGTLVVMEGPLFSTRAESELYRSWGASLIGMTALPEAKLAREAELCYAAVACATDYDCWHESAESVTVELVIANLLKNVEVSKEIVAQVAGRLGGERTCVCAHALANAIVTNPALIPVELRQRYSLLLDKYLPPLPSEGKVSS